jgi:hypothetical protein
MNAHVKLKKWVIIRTQAGQVRYKRGLDQPKQNNWCIKRKHYSSSFFFPTHGAENTQDNWKVSEVKFCSSSIPQTNELTQIFRGVADITRLRVEIVRVFTKRDSKLMKIIGELTRRFWGAFGSL